MNTLHDLTEAFDELDRRADEHAASTHPAADRPVRSAHRSRVMILAPAAGALAVAAVAIGTVAWAHGGTDSAGAPGPTTTPSGSVPVTSIPSTSPSPVTTTPAGASWLPPATASALTQRARTILAGTATITVIDDDTPTGSPSSSGPQPTDSSVTPATPDGPAPSAGNGAGIRGLLTAQGHTGGYDLSAFVADPTTPPVCEDPGTATCTVKPMPGGRGYLLITRENNATVPGGRTVGVELLRADGADIMIHLSTQRDPKGGNTPVLSAQLPLTEQQLIAFVTSDRW